MATIKYTGNAAAAIQQVTFTPSAPDAGDIYTLTMYALDGAVRIIEYTAVTDDTAILVCAGLVAAWNDSADEYISTITAEDSLAGTFTLTADVPGIMFCVVGSATGGETLTQAVVSAVQVHKFTPSDPAQNDTFTLTLDTPLGPLALVTTIGATHTVAQACTDIAAIWNASTNPYAACITAAATATEVTLTSDTGMPFSVVGTCSAGTFTKAVVTAAAGSPYDWNNAANWSTGVLPGAAASHDVSIEDATLYYGLNQSTIANTLTSLTTRRVKCYNPAPGATPIYLQIKATLVGLDEFFGTGSSTPVAPIGINTGTTASTIIVYNSGTNEPATMPAVRLLANSASTNIFIRKGIVGIADADGETATIGTINIDDYSESNNETFVYVGAGVTVTTINKNGGNLVLRAAAVTVSQDSGTILTEGTGAITTLNNYGGDFTGNSTGTIAAANGYGGTLNFLKSLAARTVTTMKIDPGCTLKYNPTNLTLTNKIAPVTTTKDIQIIAAAA